MQGDVLLSADFTNDAVNDAVRNRTSPDRSGPELADVVLVPAKITPGGGFAGNAESSAQDAIGTYSGAFGGRGATAVA